jgi:hypothetical protein
MRRLLVTAAVLGAFGAGCCRRSAAAPPPAEKPQRLLPASPSRIAGEYLVTLAPGADAAVIESLFGPLGLKQVRSLGNDVYLVAFGEDPGPERLEALRAKDARVRAVQPNLTYRAL